MVRAFPRSRKARDPCATSSTSLVVASERSSAQSSQRRRYGADRLDVTEGPVGLTLVRAGDLALRGTQPVPRPSAAANPILPSERCRPYLSQHRDRRRSGSHPPPGRHDVDAACRAVAGRAMIDRDWAVESAVYRRRRVDFGAWSAPFRAVGSPYMASTVGVPWVTASSSGPVGEAGASSQPVIAMAAGRSARLPWPLACREVWSAKHSFVTIRRITS
jgi:hypothetical protein